jgi:hypothetical protein
MSIKFFNVKSGETREASTEPMIAAFWSSSDLGPNIQQGQDFGWRLAPETAVEIKRIKKNHSLLRDIAQRYQVLPENITDSIVLKFMADRDALAVQEEVEASQDFTDEYTSAVKELEQKLLPKPTPKVPVLPTPIQKR